tara:strand:+ start:74 stop:1366 length:1293 start_codon:yes stop_codon:yes gene_type:complete
MKIISQTDKNFNQIIETLLKNRSGENDSKVEGIVKKIIEAIKQKGDSALFQYTKKYDRINLTRKNIQVSIRDINSAYNKVPKKNVIALKRAAHRIKKFHSLQKEKSWKIKEKTGMVLGQIIKPIRVAGLYAPGGKAAYPSSILMNAIPAKIAGVKKLVLCTPTPGGEINPYVLIAADIAGVDEIFRIGGAQAIAAMAFGTKSISKVDKIVGPGNVYVATAKKHVFGIVDIDMIAGPSEIFIVADGSGIPEFIAADMLSQAEHDEQAISILATNSRLLATKTISALKSQTKSSPRSEIIKKSLKKNCKIILVKNLKEAARISNYFAPEHLELAVKNPDKLLKLIDNAGAIFLGHFTPEATGDYAAGPNHVLPTGGTARFFSPLGVYDFYKRTSLISCGRDGLKSLAEPVINIAEMEGLHAHAEAVRIRLRT